MSGETGWKGRVTPESAVPLLSIRRDRTAERQGLSTMRGIIIASSLAYIAWVILYAASLAARLLMHGG